MAKPTYTKHARDQMAERGISTTEVEAALTDYHTRYTDRAGNHIVIAHVHGRRIKVVYARNSDPPHVITAADYGLEEQRMRRHVIGHRHDPEADAVYIRLSDKTYSFGEDLDPDRRIDYAADRTPIGIELLSVSHGVELGDLPYREEVAEVLARAGVPVLAA